MQQNPWDFANPPSMEPVRGAHPWLWLISAALVLALLAASIFVPIPIFFAYLPGPIRDVEKLIDVSDARSYSSEGSLYLTTVSVDTQVTLLELAQAAFDEERSIVMQQDVTQGASLQELRRQQQEQIRASKRQAQQVALGALGFARPHGDGALVEATVKDSPAAGKIKPGDVIVEIDGSTVETTCDVGRGVDAHDIGEEVSVIVKRDGERKTIRLKSAPNPLDETSAFLGVHMSEVNYSFDPGFKISFATGEIAGPSAGLMLSLALYDRLTPEDLTAGREIAGTGEISCDGGVGPIGGIEQKVAAAEHKGAEIFLAPQANADAARSVADGIEIVAISTFDDAVEYLENLD